jgi:UDP-glucose 4-epimerase
LIGNAVTAILKNDPSMNVFELSHSNQTKSNTIHIDFNQPWNYDQLPKEIDAIVHLAQSEKFRDFPGSAAEVFEVNTNSTLKLLEYARRAGAKKFIYASSGGVYGNSDLGFSEDSPLHPNKDLGFYLTTKFCSELLVENYTSFFDVNILRFFFAFGEKQKKNMLIPRLIESVRHQKPIMLQGKEGIKINPIYVEDAAKAVVSIIEAKGSYHVNIGGNEILSIKQLSELISAHLKMVPVFEYQDMEAKNLIGDISRLKKLYIPTTGINEALKKLIDYHG